MSGGKEQPRAVSASPPFRMASEAAAKGSRAELVRWEGGGFGSWAVGTSTPPNSRAPETLESSSQQKPGTEGLIDTCARGPCLMNPNKIHRTLKTPLKELCWQKHCQFGPKGTGSMTRKALGLLRFHRLRNYRAADSGPFHGKGGRRAWGQEPRGRARAWKVSHGAGPRPRQGTAMASDSCVLPALHESVYNGYPSLLGV